MEIFHLKNKSIKNYFEWNIRRIHMQSLHFLLDNSSINQLFWTKVPENQRSLNPNVFQTLIPAPWPRTLLLVVDIYLQYWINMNAMTIELIYIIPYLSHSSLCSHQIKYLTNASYLEANLLSYTTRDWSRFNLAS